MELGSGFGYSAYWFARAVGEGGEVHCTDGDPDNAVKAHQYLQRAGLWDRVSYHTGDAVELMATIDGEFDIVYDDIDKHGYPDAWLAARERIRVGGLYVCDNVLWSGRVLPGADDGHRFTAGVKEFTRRLMAHKGFLTTIEPTRDGVAVALKL